MTKKAIRLAVVVVVLVLGFAVSFVAGLLWDPEGLEANLEAMAVVWADARHYSELKRLREEARKRLAEEDDRRARDAARGEAQIREQSVQDNEPEVWSDEELKPVQVVHPVPPPQELPLVRWPLPHRRPPVMYIAKTPM